MAEIKEFPARGGLTSGGKPTTERPKPFDTTQGKPEKPANVVLNEEFEKRRQEIITRRREKEEAKSPAQIKREALQRFIHKIKELKKQFGKEGEDK